MAGSFTAIFGAHRLNRRAMASMVSRSAARLGFTWAHTYPVAPPVFSYCGNNCFAACVTTMRIRPSARSSGCECPDNTSRISAAHAPLLADSARLARNGFVVAPMAPRSIPTFSSVGSAESCHQVVFVLPVNHCRYCCFMRHSGHSGHRIRVPTPHTSPPPRKFNRTKIGIFRDSAGGWRNSE